MVRHQYFGSLILLLVFFQCTSMNMYDTCKQKLPNSLSGYSFITNMTNSQQKTMLKIYGIEIKNGVYSNLEVCKSGKDNEVVYRIEKTNFYNPCGKETIPINTLDFFGYRVLLVKDGYFEIQPFWDKEAKVFSSDSIIIKWNDDKKVFEILLIP